MSRHFEKVKDYYDCGLWDIARVKNAVVNPANSPWITAEEFKEITKFDYLSCG